MRLPARSLATLFIGVAVATCSSDVATAPHQTTTRESIAIDPAAIAVSAHIADFGITYDHVRIVLIRPAADTVKDTTFVSGSAPLGLAVGISATSDVFSGVILTVDALTANEVFTVIIDFTNANGVVFHGTGQATAHPASDPAGAPQPIVVNYVGPGATVARIVVSPKTVSLVGSAAQTFTVAAFDANSAPLVSPVQWTTSDPSVATISADGKLATTGKRGSVTISATTPNGISDNASVTVSLPAAAIHLVSGANQTGKAGAALAAPGVVSVTAADGVGIAGVTVTFTAPAGGAVGTSSAITDANGTASTSLTLGKTVGAQSFTAFATGFTVAIPEAATAGDAAGIIAISGSGQSDTVRKALALPLVVKVVDAFNNPVAGVTVNWSRTGVGTLGAATSVAGTDGQTSISYTLGAVAESETITASISGVATTATFSVQAIAAGPTALVWTVQPTGVTAGIAMAPALEVIFVDATGALANVAIPVAISLSGGASGATLSGTLTRTSVSGIVEFNDLRVDKAGAGYSLIATPALASVPAKSSATFNAVAGSATTMTVTGDNQTATASTAVAIAPSVKIVDANGNPIQGLAVTFAPATGSGVVAPASAVTTNALGVASVTSWTLGASAGAQSLIVSTAGLASVTIHATAIAGAAGTIAIVAGDNQSATVGTATITAPSVKVTDASNNPVSGAVVTFAAATGSGSVSPINGQATTNASGIATLNSWTLGTTTGAQSLTASAAGTGGATFHATATVGAAAKLAITQQPSSSASSGFTLSTQPLLQVEDQFGNAAPAGTTTIVAAPSAGAASGNSVSANVTTGAIAFTSLAVTTTASSVTITFSAPGTPGITPITSGSIAITQAAASQLVLTPAAPTTYTKAAGQALNPSPSLQTLDAVGNVVAGTQVNFVVAQAGVQIGSTQQLTSNASGLIDEANLTNLPSTVGTYTVTGALASNAGVTKAITLTVVAGAAGSITTVAGDNQSATVGTAVIAAPSVKVTDASSNPVSGVVVTFAAATGSGSVAPAGGQVTTSAAGIATLTSWTLGTTAGAQSLVVSAAGLTSVTIHATALAGAAGIITIVAGDNQSATVGTAVTTAPSAKVTDASSNPLAGVVVTFAVASGSGTTSPVNGQATTNALGVAALTSWTLGTNAGAQSLTASATGTGTVTFHATATAGVPSNITIVAGDNQSATVGTAVITAPSVKVTDASSNPLPGVIVTFTAASGSGSVSPINGQATTNASGIATLTSWTLGTTAGAQSLVVSAAGLTSVTIHATAVAGAATSIAVVSGTGQTAQIGAALTNPLVVKVTDASANPVSNVTITWVATNGTLGAPTTTSNASGLSSNTLTAGATVGGATATASIVGGANAAFAEVITAGPVVGLTLTTPPQTTDSNNVAFTAAPVVQLVDASNNAVALANVVVTMTAVPPSSGTPATAPTLLVGTSATITATTNASGIATFTGVRAVGLAQDYALKFSATPVATTYTRTSSDIHLLVGPASQLIATAGDGQEALINTAVAIAARAQLRDTLAQATTYPVATITYSVSGTGAGATPSSTSTNGTGLADATWTLGGTEGAAVLTAHATLGGAARTATFNATASDIHAMALTATPGTATNGLALSPQPAIQLNDGTANHNALHKSGVVITATVTSAPGSTGGIANNTATFTRSGTATATTDANGLATFANLGVLSTQGGLTGRFTFTVTSGTTQTIAAITTDVLVNAGAAVSIQRNTNTVLTTVVGTAFSTFPSVILRDVAGSPVPNSAGVSITFSVPSGSCTTSAVLTTTAADGTATLSSGNLTVPNVAGSCLVRATSSSLAGSPIDWDIVVGPVSGFTWLGAIDSDYTRNLNWLGSVAPGSGAVDIFVPKTVPIAPSVIAATTVRNVTLEAGASFNVGQSVYTITGTTSAGTGSTVSILSGATALFQGATTTLDNLTVNSGTVSFSHNATVNGALSALGNAVVNHTAGGLTLTIAGSLTSSSGTTLSGLTTVKFTGSTFPVYGNATTAGTPVITQISHNMSVPGGTASFVNNLTISDAALSVNGDATVLTVGGALDVKSSTGAAGELLMNSGDPTVIVTGAAIFEGKAQNGQGLTTGTLDLRGDFTQRDRTSGAHGEFEPGPLPFLVKFTGGGSGQNVSFDHPGTSPTTGSYFTNVLVTNQGGVTQSTTAYVNSGTMTVGGPPADAGSPAFWNTGIGSNTLFVTGGGALAVRQSGSFTVASGGTLDLTGGSCTQYQAGLVSGSVIGGTCTVDAGLIGSVESLFRMGSVAFRR